MKKRIHGMFYGFLVRRGSGKRCGGARDDGAAPGSAALTGAISRGAGLPRRLIGIAAVLAGTGLISADSSARPPDHSSLRQGQKQGTIRVRVRMIPVDVTVTDARGRPVADLKQEEFQILENGHLQEIRHFFVQKSAPSHAQAGRPAIPAEPQLPPPEIAPQTGRTFLILMGHGRHQLPFQSLDALIRFVRNDLMPRDRVAVFAYTRLTDFTTEHQRVSRFLERYKQSCEAIEAWREEQAYMLSSVFPGELIGRAPEVLYRMFRSSKSMQSAISGIFSGPEGLGSRQVAAARMPENAAFTLDRARITGMLQQGLALGIAESTGEFGSAVAMTALEQMASEALRIGLPGDVFVREAEGSVEDMANIFTGVEQLRFQPGDKHLLFFTEFGLCFPFGNTVYDDYIATYAADARVAIDTFQTGGLDSVQLRSPSRSASLARGRALPSASWGQSAMIAAVKSVSRQTGGRAAVFEDIGRALARLNESSRVEYLLGYYPKEENWDGRYRKIEVKVSRPGVEVSFRHGYFARESMEPAVPQDRQAEYRVADTGASILEIGDVAFTTAANQESDPAGPQQIRVSLEIDPASVSFTTGNGVYTARLRIAVFYADEKERYQGEDVRTMDLQLPEDSYRRIRQSVIPYSTLIPLKAPDPILKAIVYDMQGDKTGSKVFRLTKQGK